MAKKRKASNRSQPTGPKELDEKDARLGPITTYEDVADSEDEFFMNRDRIMLDEPSSKRRRQTDDDEYEFSDEEVFARDDDSDDGAAKKKAKKTRKGADSEDEGEGGDAEEDTGYWGSSKGDYYNADNIETEADALAEEKEAKRLQQKKLSKMAEQDFIFDEDEWMKPDAEKEDEQEVVTEVLKDVEITDDMGPEERYRLLKARYPEFEHLAKDFEQLQPSLLVLKDAAAGQPAKSLAAVKYWVLGCYVAALASYFAILTSPARDASKQTKPLSPADLRDHEVMETLVECRDEWQRIQHMKSTIAEAESDSSIPDVEAVATTEPFVAKTKKSKKEAKADALAEKKRQRKLEKKLEQARAAEASVADLYDLPLGPTTKSKKRRREEATEDVADNSDFGEEDALDERTAAEKAARKKSLKFYTSQIVQKANRRADAGRDAGGDADLPYRERFRDRQARLMAAAEKRGQKDSKFGADLGDESDEDDGKVANAMRDDEDDYYDMVANSAAKKREEKAARAAALANAGKADRVVENEVIGEDGKRKVTYAIEKNKGLAPKRSKDVRNPRVKKRKQYEAKQKKLRSMKPIWKGGEPVGGYQGERTGVNINVIKSTKL